MKIVEERVYVGPNLHALFPVVRMTIDLESLEHRPTSSIPRFIEQLLAAVPSLREHGCSIGGPGGFVRRLHEGTWMGHVLEHVAIAMQNRVEQDISFGKTRGNGTHGHYDVVFACRDLEIGRLAGRAAFDLLQALLPRELGGQALGAVGAREHLEAFEHAARARRLGPSTSALVEAAQRRGIPWRRIGEGSLVTLGHGRHMKRLWGTIGADTSSVGVDLACDKATAHDLLEHMGLPVPPQLPAQTLQEARDAAASLGLPVVVKPRGGNHGRGVVLVEELAGLREAFDAASRVGPVLVEAFLPGADHRLLVVGGRLVAAARRIPGQVVGDGQHSIEELVQAVNADPRRGEGHEHVLTMLELDDEAQRMLKRLGLRSRDVPAQGQVVVLRETANLSTGGTAIDVTDEVHPDNAEVAIRAARLVGLDVAGVDFITPDIARSHREVGGGICEVNAGPGLRMHLHPTQGKARQVADPIIDLLFPPKNPGSIPIAMVTGTNGKTTTCRMLAAIWQATDARVGMTTTDGVYVDGRCICPGDLTGPQGTQMVLEDPNVDVAVLELGRGGILRAGLGTAVCDVAAVINVSEDHLGLGGIDTVQQLAHLKSVVVEVARDTVVLNADDPLVRRMRERCRAQRVVWIATSATSPFVQGELASGQLIVTLQGRRAEETMVLLEGTRAHPIVRVTSLPVTLRGMARHNVENAMFAAGLALGHGIPISTIRTALTSFACDMEHTPGRLNLYEEHPFRVIVDYGHNAAGFARIGEMVSTMPVRGRRICVAGIAGDRRDVDFEAAAAALAPHFDLFICRGEDDPRGRGSEEIPQLMAFGLRQADVDPSRILVESDELEATRLALRTARAGDLVVLFAVRIGDVWELVRNFESCESEEVQASI